MTDTHTPLIRVMALHALAYCERLFYLEEVEEIRLADEAVYAGRRLHEELQDDDGDRFTIEIQDEELGLKGKADCVRYRDGRLIPYEHKRANRIRLTAYIKPGRRIRYRSARMPCSWRSIRAEALQKGAFAIIRVILPSQCR